MTEPFRTISLSDPAYQPEGLRTVTVKSRALARRADISVWAPEAQEIRTLLILLHGVYGSHWSWALEGGVHRIARRLLVAGEIAPLVLAMPSDGLRGDGSAYLHFPGAEDCEQWIVEEVPLVARIAAPALCPDAAVVLAGLSMGGYGALRLGAKYPNHFRGISAHSAITEIIQIANFVEEPLGNFLATAPLEELNPLYWLRKHRANLPALRFDCGTNDSLLATNRVLDEQLRTDGIAHLYEEFPGGHDWRYWSAQVVRTLRFANQLSVMRAPDLYKDNRKEIGHISGI